MLGSKDRRTTFGEQWEPVGIRQGGDVVSLSRVPILRSMRAFLLCYPVTVTTDLNSKLEHCLLQKCDWCSGMSACSDRKCEEGYVEDFTEQ